MGNECRVHQAFFEGEVTLNQQGGTAARFPRPWQGLSNLEAWLSRRIDEKKTSKPKPKFVGGITTSFSALLQPTIHSQKAYKEF
jgi:hypothetical protein